ncbi:MAG: hypothetical protein KY476_03670 [Planctomycetes bacterium]|nr:hypothetical protein [Planctomycetota bacterium]
MSEAVSTKPEATPAAPRRSRRRRLVCLLVLLALVGAACWYWSPWETARRRVEHEQTLRRALEERLSRLEQRVRRLERAGQQASDAANASAGSSDTSAASPAAETDEEYRRRMVGTWSMYEHGDRVMTLNADGTGLLVYDPALEARLYYGLEGRVEADITWNVDNGRALFDSTTGRPADDFQKLSEDRGSHRDLQIVEINDRRMLLYEEAKDKFREWKPVTAGTNQ